MRSRAPVYPFSRGGLTGSPDGLLAALLADPAAAVAALPTSPTTRHDGVGRVVAGGFSLVLPLLRR